MRKMNRLKKISEYRHPLLIGVIIISLLINCYMSFHDDSVFILCKKVLVDGEISKVYFSTGLDQFLDKAVPEGNMVLKFKGFGKLKRESDEDVPLLIYFRAVYRLYPQKVFTVSPDVIVNTGKDFTDNPFNPDLQWMQKNGVKKVITLTRDLQGRIYNKVDSIPAE